MPQHPTALVVGHDVFDPFIVTEVERRRLRAERTRTLLDRTAEFLAELDADERA